jgi:chemotaxis protein CheD
LAKKTKIAWETIVIIKKKSTENNKKMVEKTSVIFDTIPGFEHINRYYDRTLNIAAAKILPGELYVTQQNEVIVTVLGSCVSACIRDIDTGLGGMNHFMLPVQDDMAFRVGDDLSDSTRYGNWAMEFLINTLLKYGGKKPRLEIKIVGGGQVISAIQNIDVGKKNIEFVKEYLKKERLFVVGEDVGGPFPRKVYYFPQTGVVKVKKIQTTANDTILLREKEYADHLKNQNGNDVELF